MQGFVAFLERVHIGEIEEAVVTQKQSKKWVSSRQKKLYEYNILTLQTSIIIQDALKEEPRVSVSELESRFKGYKQASELQ
ncbi:19395_t:CDS:2 [Funneliformis geosporum]|uniref:19395_t:CDS:1 n=1 Tax=Funneliformis geosporum TaxID=1117311 RepID=A0A9W4SSR7_9GLOM|nr:19395_t:CDS:2 [Funneliformis geosporum]